MEIPSLFSDDDHGGDDVYDAYDGDDDSCFNAYDTHRLFLFYQHLYCDDADDAFF